MRLELYAFEYFDELRQRWMRARYKATKAEIAATYPLHRLVGASEVWEVNDDPGKRFPTRPS